MADHGYTKALHREAPYGRGCPCPEELEHDGKCQNALREKKSTTCIPCSEGWHLPYPCTEWQSKGLLTLTTQCSRCGWDSADHPDTEESIRKIRDSRVKRDDDGRYPGYRQGD